MKKDGKRNVFNVVLTREGDETKVECFSDAKVDEIPLIYQAINVWLEGSAKLYGMKKAQAEVSALQKVKKVPKADEALGELQKEILSFAKELDGSPGDESARRIRELSKLIRGMREGR